MSDVGQEAARVAQERLYGRIPLLYAQYSLTTGKVVAQLLDKTFRRRRGELLSAVTDGLAAWMTSGLSAVFRPEDVLLLAPAGYAYQKPSGSRSKYFLKPDLALTSSASVGFVALALFHRLFAGRLERTLELQSVFVDTMAIAPIAYGLRDLLALCDFRQPFLIESFHSYGGLEAVRRPLPRTSTGATLHTLRHTFASKLAQNGATLQEIKELMGHSSIVTTMIYAHLLENKAAKRAVEILNAL